MTKTKDELIESWWPEGSGHSAYSSGACDGASKMYDHRQKEIDELREQVKWWAINWQKIRELQKQKQTDAAVFLGRTIMLEADAAAKKILEG